MSKEEFLQQQLVSSLEIISPDFKPLWGKMNVQQMIEHLSREGFQYASGKLSHVLVTPEEYVPKMQSFIMSDKPFKENTVNVLMTEEPYPIRHSSMEDALNELQDEINDFFEIYQRETGKVVINPFFGPLDFDMQVRLLHKHATHHLKQFGVEI